MNDTFDSAITNALIKLNVHEYCLVLVARDQAEPILYKVWKHDVHPIIDILLQTFEVGDVDYTFMITELGNTGHLTFAIFVPADKMVLPQDQLNTYLETLLFMAVSSNNPTVAQKWLAYTRNIPI